MSACISRHGEYSEHAPDVEWVCTLCGEVDTAGLRAEVDRLRAGIEALVTRYRAAWDEDGDTDAHGYAEDLLNLLDGDEGETDE